MNIKSIRAFAIDPSRAQKKHPAAYKRQDRQPAGPLDRYADYRSQRSL